MKSSKLGKIEHPVVGLKHMHGAGPPVGAQREPGGSRGVPGGSLGVPSGLSFVQVQLITLP